MRQELERIAKLKHVEQDADPFGRGGGDPFGGVKADASEEDKLQRIQCDCYFAMMLIDATKGMEILATNLKSNHAQIAEAARKFSQRIESGESEFK